MMLSGVHSVGVGIKPLGLVRSQSTTSSSPHAFRCTSAVLSQLRDGPPWNRTLAVVFNFGGYGGREHLHGPAGRARAAQYCPRAAAHNRSRCHIRRHTHGLIEGAIPKRGLERI